MAVAKYRTQGLGAWTTYTSGAYKAFLQGNVPPNVGGAADQGPTSTAGFNPLGSIIGTFAALGQAVDWLVQPNKQIRILAFILGTGALLLGVSVLGFGVGGGKR
jgi:hypothetical protein